ncbi:glycosyltransferase family 2 protein [Salinarimonas ramus]|uniref:Glycosyl transferase n=1 Tax=Salinarimonas ramus TaxID=690164 RepID=A0A917QFX5_9HYPH|nr:glycosyltransferase family 2 protein [Salinarimonas ramus]GGK47040.1 glycosyl transferase [Salinarimonas ramus]
MSAAAPLVTIAMTCFDARETVLRALESAFAQDWPSREILVVDDASADDTATIVETAVAGRSDARLVRHSRNSGVGAARATLLEEARGTFVVFFDDDDTSGPSRVRVQIERILAEEARRPGPVVCYASGRRIYPSGHAMSIDAIGSRDTPPSGADVAAWLLVYERRPGLFYGGGTPACSLAARCEDLRRVGGFDPRLRRLEDVDLAIRLAFAGATFVGTTERLYTQYATTGNDKTPERNLTGELAIVEKHAAFLQEHGLLDYARRWPMLRYRHFAGDRPGFVRDLVGLLLRHPVRTTRHLLATGPKRLSHERAAGRGGGRR